MCRGGMIVQSVRADMWAGCVWVVAQHACMRCVMTVCGYVPAPCSLKYNRIGDAACSKLAEALAVNSSLQELT